MAHIIATSCKEAKQKFHKISRLSSTFPLETNFNHDNPKKKFSSKWDWPNDWLIRSAEINQLRSVKGHASLLGPGRMGSSDGKHFGKGREGPEVTFFLNQIGVGF